MKGSLVTMRGPAEDVAALQNMNDVEAGIAMLGLIGNLYPNLRMSQLFTLANPDAMGLSFNPISMVKSVAGDIKDGVASVVSDTLSFVGDKAGSAVRLVTDPKVQQGAQNLAAAYATDGGSSALQGLLGPGASPDSASTLQQILAYLGAGLKSLTGAAGSTPAPTQSAGVFGMNSKVVPWAIGGTVLAAVLLLRRPAVGRR